MNFCVCVGLLQQTWIVDHKYSIFSQKKIHQWSWTHPNQKEGEHVLDYILVNQKFRASIFDTRTHRQSAHISDHNPVVSKIRIDFKRQKTKTNNNNFKHNKPATFNFDNETIEKVQNEMKHCLHKRKFSNVNEIWYGFKLTIKTTITQLLPKKATKAEKSWVTENLKTLTKKKVTHILKSYNCGKEEIQSQSNLEINIIC